MTDTITIHGETFGLGLKLPISRPTRCMAFGEKFGILTKDQVGDILTDPNRVPRRQLFPGSEWIGNQGNIGSCNGWAGAKALERARVLRGLPRVRLSGIGLYMQINGGRDQGSMLDDGMDALTKNGCPTEATVPPNKFQGPSQFTGKIKEEAARFRAFECWRIDTEEELASALAQNFMCVVAVHVGGQYQSLDARGVRNASSGPGNHAVGCQDVRIAPDGEYEFDEVGSWGTKNGTDGYAWLRWNRTFRTTIGNHAFYAISSATDDTQVPVMREEKW